MPQLAVVVVVEQMDALGCQGFAGFVQPLCKFVHGGFIAVIKPVHPGDDHILCAETFSFLGHCVGIPLQRAKVGVQADHLQACLLHQRVPVQIAALAHRHTGGLGQQLYHKTNGVDHKSTQFNAVVPGGFHGSKGLFGLLLVA